MTSLDVRAAMAAEQGGERPVDSIDGSTRTEVVVEAPFLVLELENDQGETERGEFRAFEDANQWAIMQNAAARKGTRSDQAAALHELARTSIRTDVVNEITGQTEVERFQEWMMRHGRDPKIYDRIWDALNLLWAGRSRFPLERTFSDSGPSTGTTEPDTTDSFSEPGSEPPTGATGWPVLGESPALDQGEISVESGSSFQD